MRAKFRAGKAQPIATLGLQPTRRAERALHQFRQRVNETRGRTQGRSAQVEWHAKLPRQLRVLNVQLDQRLDVVRHEGDGREDDAN